MSTIMYFESDHSIIDADHLQVIALEHAQNTNCHGAHHGQASSLPTEIVTKISKAAALKSLRIPLSPSAENENYRNGIQVRW